VKIEDLSKIEQETREESERRRKGVWEREESEPLA